MDADVRIETIEGVQVFTPRIRAEIDPDGDNVWEFHDAVLPLIEAEGSRAVIDLGSSTACDLLLGALVMLHKRARARGGRVVMAGLDARMREFFRISKLDGYLEIFSSLESAILELGTEVSRNGLPLKAPS